MSERKDSSVDAMRNLGSIPGHEISKVPFAMQMVSESSAKMLEEHNKPWQEQSENIPTSVKNLREIRNMADPLDPREEARMRSILGPERFYERDPLGLYSAASNYADSMLKFYRTPLDGSADFDIQAEEAVIRLSSMDKNPDLNKLRDFAKKELRKQIAESREELGRNFALAVASGNRSVTETLAMLESFVPPKPFEANMQERRLSDGRQALESMPVYFGKFNTDTQQFETEIPKKLVAWYRTYDGVNEQQFSLFNILCAAGGGMEGYYDALKQAGETLISRARYHANVHDFRAAYTNDNPGVSTSELDPEEKSHIKDTLASKELRELQVEMLSQARRLTMFNVDVGQVDFDKPDGQEGLINKNDAVVDRFIKKLTKKADDLIKAGNTEEANRVRGHIDSVNEVKKLNIKNHREFMRLVFGELDKSKWLSWKSPDTSREITAPKEILTWYGSGDKLGQREEWLSKMMAVLTWKAPDGKRLSDVLETADDARVLEIANEIVTRSQKIRNNIGDKVMNADPEFTAAKIALISWIEKDKGFQVSGSLAWMYKYDNEISGKSIKDGVARMYDAGGLYKAFDSINLWAYWRRWATYKAGWKSATTFFGPASDSWRRDVAKHGPDWLPPLENINKNEKIKRIHDRFFNDTPDMMLWRAQRLTGNSKLTEKEMNDMIVSGKLKPPKIDDEVKAKLIEAGWTFESAWGVPVPMYLPKNFKINVFELMADKKTGDTVWDLMRVGIMPKDIDWDNYNYETLDRMWVSMSMLVRFAHLFVDPYEAERDPSYQGFFKEANPQSIAEMTKRVYLAFRDLPEGYQNYAMAIVPFMIAQNTASMVGLTSPELGGGNKEKVLKQWNYVMGQWIRAAMWMPEVILDDEQLFNGDEAKIKSFRNDMALMIMYYKHIFEKVGQAAYKADAHKLQNLFMDQMDLYSGSLKDIMEPEKNEANFGFGVPKIPISWLDGEKAVSSLLFGDRH